MSLSKDSIEKLNNQFKSYDSIFSLSIDIIKLGKPSKFKILRIIRIIVTFLLTISISLYTTFRLEFNPIFEYMTGISITFSVGLLCLLIAGLTIVLSSLSKNSIYALILQQDENKKNQISFYKKTLIQCVEPLMWFLILLIESYFLKISYFFYKTITIYQLAIPFVKFTVIFILTLTTLISIFSLGTFILNMYNLLAANARFEILERHAKSNNISFDILLAEFENQFNNINNI